SRDEGLVVMQSLERPPHEGVEMLAQEVVEDAAQGLLVAHDSPPCSSAASAAAARDASSCSSMVCRLKSSRMDSSPAVSGSPPWTASVGEAAPESARMPRSLNRSSIDRS